MNLSVGTYFLQSKSNTILQPASQPEIVRQKTWSTDSIHDPDGARILTAGPTRTSSPLHSQNVTQDLEEMSLQIRDSRLTKRLEEASEKIKQAMLMLNSNKDKNVTTYSRYFVSATFSRLLLYRKSAYMLSRKLCLGVQIFAFGTLPENFKLHYPILWNLSSFIDIERYRETR
jgi:hypothetical protein